MVAQHSIDRVTIESLRGELDKNKQRQTFNPIDPKHEAGRASVVGPEDMVHVRMQREREEEFEAAEVERKRAKKAQVARNKAEKRENKGGGCRRWDQGSAEDHIWR